MWQNWKGFAVPLLLVAGLFLAPGTSWGQRPRGGFSADSMFDRLLSSYGGSGDTLDYSRIPANRRFGPMPTSGTVSREKYRADFEQRMQEMRSRWGGSRSRDGDSGGRPSFFSRGGPSGMSGGSSNDLADNIFKQRDRNGDGRITPDEASGGMQRRFSEYDKNGDGSVDLNELRAYTQQRYGNRDSSSSMSPSSPNGSGGWNNNDKRDRRNRGDSRNDKRNDQRGPNQPEEDALPVVYRYGKLPKELPSWFTELDTDKDGQVGLYEWRRDGSRSTKEFLALDLNGDGYLTADEWLRVDKLAKEKEKKAGSDSTSTSASTSTTRNRRGSDNSSRSNGRRSRGGPGSPSKN